MFYFNNKHSVGTKKLFSLIFLFMLIIFTTFSQESFYTNRKLFYNKLDSLTAKGNYYNALQIINNLQQQNALSYNEYNYLKGYVYSVKYQTRKNEQDFDSCMHYFPNGLFSLIGGSKSIVEHLTFLSNFYYKKTADALQNVQIDSAEYYYLQSRKALLLVDSSTVYQRDINFYLAIASSSNELFEKNKNNISYAEKSLNYYNKVLQLDSNNFSATYNIMVIHYNKAVVELKKADYCKQVEIANSVDWTDPTKEIPSIEKLLECVKPEEFEKYNFTPIIKKALPFALKAYKLNPSNKHTLQALIGIYFALNDTKAVSKYKKELNKLQ